MNVLARNVDLEGSTEQRRCDTVFRSLMLELGAARAVTVCAAAADAAAAAAAALPPPSPHAAAAAAAL